MIVSLSFSFTVDSRVTLRLIHPNNRSSSGSEDIAPLSNASLTSDNPHCVILFVRLENEGYCCLGPVKYVAMDLQQHPIQMKWELMSFSTLSSLDYFQTILKENR